MDLRYKVPRESYIQLLVDMIQLNERRPLRMAMAFLMTIGQMLIVAFLCLTRFQGNDRIFFAVWSVLIAAITVLRRKTRKQRAKGTLTRLEYNGQLSQDYWKEHHLRQLGDTLTVSYGDVKLSCPVRGITSIEEKHGDLFLYVENTVFDIIPASAFSGAEGMSAFAQRLRRESETAKGNFSKMQSASRSDALTWTMDTSDFLSGQLVAYQRMYYRFRFIRPATFIRLAISIACVVSMLHERSPIAYLIGIAVILTANIENISMIPFICRFRIEREIGQWKGSERFSLEAEETTLLYTSNCAQIRIPVSSITLSERTAKYFIIAWNKFPAIVLPEDVCRDSKFHAILERLPSDAKQISR